MAKAYVRLSIQITPEVNEKLEELAKEYGTKKEVIEQAIIKLYNENQDSSAVITVR